MRKIIKDKRGVVTPIALLLIIGVLVYFAIKGGLIGTNPASIVQQNIPTSQKTCVVDYAQISTITAMGGSTGNYTFTVDTVDKSNYYVDTGNKTADVSNATAEINGSFIIYLTPDSIPVTSKECNVVVYAVSPSYRSEDETGADANNIWDLLDSSKSASLLNGLEYSNRVSPIRWSQDIWLNNGVGVSTSSNNERTAILYTAGESSDTLGFLIDIEPTALGHLIRNSPSKQIVFYQQLGGSPSLSDKKIATLTLRKGVLNRL